jgi:hypothetical protein
MGASGGLSGKLRLQTKQNKTHSIEYAKLFFSGSSKFRHGPNAELAYRTDNIMREIDGLATGPDAGR